MSTIQINGWIPGFKKVSCTELLRSVTGMDLIEAKQVTDGVLEGQIQYVHVATSEVARVLAELQKIGAVAQIPPEL